MQLRHFRRQYEQLSQFEMGIIICMMEAVWSARRVHLQLGHSDCVVRRCWDQWIREMSFTRRQGLGGPRQTNRRENRHIIRNAHVQPTSSSATIQTQHQISGPGLFCGPDIVTSMQEESDPVDDEKEEDQDNNNESSKGPSNADSFSAL
ncbi:transposable element Tcb2 transposase [Trichonephila clavipes]|nr:transposable element Tcb2 transposase [Trichonephila clavipes]